MAFCYECERSTIVNTAQGVVYCCNGCGTKIKGDAYSVKIKTFNIGTGQMAAETNQQLLKNAPFDRTNNIIPENCTECGRIYKKQVKLGESGIVIKLCECSIENSD